MDTSIENVESYIATFPKETQKLLEQIRQTISSVAPTATEKIGYGIPTFVLNGNLVHYAGYKNHIGFYPGAAGIEKFQEELSVYKGGKGSVQFPLDQLLPLKLVSEITKFRVVQNEQKPTTKGKKNS
ncbi:iron chaperone [Pedobacter sp.]|uniref:iron chaperone n=1 Tax=Pedobacter sp. TaxID=1411316 RepID=UPI003C3429A3